jgi:hypothetical protein
MVAWCGYVDEWYFSEMLVREYSVDDLLVESEWVAIGIDAGTSGV